MTNTEQILKEFMEKFYTDNGPLSFGDAIKIQNFIFEKLTSQKQQILDAVEKELKPIGDDNFSQHPSGIDCFNENRQSRCSICEHNMSFNDGIEKVIEVIKNL